MRAALTALALSVIAASASAKTTSLPDPAPVATPPGITLITVRIGQGQNIFGQSSATPRNRLIFADAGNKPIYTFDKDPAGATTCVDDCAKMWPPVLVTTEAKPSGNWSIVARADGTKQWAFQGKALYTYAKDAKPAAGGRMEATGEANGQDVDGAWHIIELRPSDWIELPAGISVTEVNTAPGQALVNDKGQPLYVFDVKSGPTAPLDARWKPTVAPQLALAFGDFTVVSRGDGVYQWALHGKPLYTFADDVEAGDANGKSVDQRFKVALALRYFMPREVTIMSDQRRGGVLATADTGHALYARDRAYAALQGGFNSRGANHGSVNTGKAIGLSGCDAACEQNWLPLKAPANAETSGYWSVLTRADGSKQWAFQGYALYTYAGEKPREVTGNAIFDLTVNDSTKGPGAPNLGLYWRVASP